MTLLRRRLGRLEECYPPIVLPNPNTQAQLLALQELSMTELHLLENMLLRNNPGIPLNAADQAAMDHYKEALIGVARELQIPLTVGEQENELV
jgi:hypothetical protein